MFFLQTYYVVVSFLCCLDGSSNFEYDNEMFGFCSSASSGKNLFKGQFSLQEKSLNDEKKVPSIPRSLYILSAKRTPEERLKKNDSRCFGNTDL